jgi:hypothetical protein
MKFLVTALTLNNKLEARAEVRFWAGEEGPYYCEVGVHP